MSKLRLLVWALVATALSLAPSAAQVALAGWRYP